MLEDAQEVQVADANVNSPITHVMVLRSSKGEKSRKSVDRALSRLGLGLNIFLIHTLYSLHAVPKRPSNKCEVFGQIQFTNPQIYGSGLL